jgi:hypothetical protein
MVRPLPRKCETRDEIDAPTTPSVGDAAAQKVSHAEAGGTIGDIDRIAKARGGPLSMRPGCPDCGGEPMVMAAILEQSGGTPRSWSAAGRTGG